MRAAHEVDAGSVEPEVGVGPGPVVGGVVDDAADVAGTDVAAPDVAAPDVAVGAVVGLVTPGAVTVGGAVAVVPPVPADADVPELAPVDAAPPGPVPPVPPVHAARSEASTTAVGRTARDGIRRGTKAP
ncbi:MAG: hypothetical protein JWP82_3196 [Humibacillus sp.]|nr:hypothetical protein [Humibacillus sp.]